MDDTPDNLIRCQPYRSPCCNVHANLGLPLRNKGSYGGPDFLIVGQAGSSVDRTKATLYDEAAQIGGNIFKRLSDIHKPGGVTITGRGQLLNLFYSFFVKITFHLFNSLKFIFHGGPAGEDPAVHISISTSCRESPRPE